MATSDETKVRRTEVIAKLKATLEGLGHEVDTGTAAFGFTRVDGAWVSLEVVEQGSRPYQGMRGAGRLRIKFGQWGERKQFPEPRTGFDLDKIAKAILTYIEVKRVDKKFADARRDKMAAAQKLADEINADQGFGLGYRGLHVGVTHSAELCLVLEEAVDEATARGMLAAWKQLTGAKS